MAGINFLSENYVDNGTFTITTGAANAQFPISNLQNESTAKKFRSTGNTVVFYIDLGTTRQIDSIAVAGDQAGILGITAMSIRTSTTTTFAGAGTTVDLSAEHNFGFVFITEVDHRYVEVTLTGTGSFAEVSNIFVGKRIALTQNSISTNSFKYGYGDRSSVRQNRYGQKFIDERNLQKKISGNIEFCTVTEQEQLDDMFIRHGVNRPLWLILDDQGAAMNDGKFKLSMYGYLAAVPEWSADGGQIYSTALTLDQVV